jgi:hypothetical protein
MRVINLTLREYHEPFTILRDRRVRIRLDPPLEIRREFVMIVLLIFTDVHRTVEWNVSVRIVLYDEIATTFEIETIGLKRR